MEHIEKVELHTKTGCPSCSLAKQWLDGRNVTYETILHDNHEARQEWYKQENIPPGEQFVPQIFVTVLGERLRIAGHDGLKRDGWMYFGK